MDQAGVHAEGAILAPMQEDSRQPRDDAGNPAAFGIYPTAAARLLGATMIGTSNAADCMWGFATAAERIEPVQHAALSSPLRSRMSPGASGFTR
jgi:hypothetical protein